MQENVRMQVSEALGVEAKIDGNFVKAHTKEIDEEQLDSLVAATQGRTVKIKRSGTGISIIVGV